MKKGEIGMQTEFFQNGITMTQQEGLFRLGSDAVLLADFAALPKKARVCDLCAGSGAISLLLLAREPDCRVTAVELQAAACETARANLAANGLQDRMEVVRGDLRKIQSLLPHRRFDCVVCNPPYYPVGSGKTAESEEIALARTEKACTIGDVCRAAAWLLPTGGSFFLVHKPERLCDIFCALREHRLEPKLLRLVRHDASKEASLVLIKSVSGGKPGLQLAPDLLLHNPDGSESAEYRRIYHL